MLATSTRVSLGRTPGNSATWTSCRSYARTRSPAASPCPWPAIRAPGSRTRPPRRVRLRRLAETARRADPRSRGPALASVGRVRHPLRPRRGRQEPHRPGPRPPRGALRDARFTKTSRVLAHLAGGRADRTWDKRLAELTRPTVLVLDDFAMRELTAPQADDLYELISERAGKSLILTSNRDPPTGTRCSPTPSSPEFTPGSPHQQQPPGLHERAQLPAEQTARACRPHREHERQLK